MTECLPSGNLKIIIISMEGVNLTSSSLNPKDSAIASIESAQAD